MRRILVMLCLACIASTVAAQGGRADDAAIRAYVASYASAINKRDAAAVAALFATDGDIVALDEPPAAGREAVRKSTVTQLASWAATRRITLTVRSIRYLAADVAIAEVAAQFNEGSVREDRGTNVLVKRNGVWLLAALRILPAQHP